MELEVLSTQPSNGQPPELVFVLLHGWGANYRDLMPLTPMLNLPSCLFLFPNAPFPHPHVSGGRAWYALENDNEGLEESAQALYRWLLSLEDTTGVPLAKTFLGAFPKEAL